MNNLQRYVNYVQPVVDAIEKHHNYYHIIQYHNVSAEDIYAQGGYIEFGTKGDLTIDVGDLNGDIPMIYASTQEEGGGHLVIEIAPEQRELLSPDVLSVFHGDGWNNDWKAWWNNSADQTVYLLMDHGGISERDFTGFAPSKEFEDTVGVGHALDFISHRLGLNYLFIHDGCNDLEYVLNCEE
tara:strand:- start:2 stop:550 length:549 start_codon:yes stop_codon:yes gene_type:complete